MRTNRARDVEVADLDVVIVETSKPVQGIIRSILFAARVSRVRVFDDAEEAYRAMLVEPPHLAMVADEIGAVDGLTLVRTMRDPRSGPLVAVPVILTSYRPTRRLVERCIAVGIHFVLAKPLSPANVMQRIEAVVRDRRLFVYEERLGFHVLDDHDSRLAGQRERWHDLHEGVAAFPVSADDIDAEPLAPPRRRPEPREVVELDETRPRTHGWGFAVPLREPPRETSTGQPTSRTA